ncbi:ABC transporter permease [Streptococcus sobrinus]|uniref:ABC transporter permease n=2 Tax=Streptococcus sobrinus TaxID=1310 RepID=A0ABM6W3T8_9STRE|nr:ABC transporter permease [Streptococcus sobrinus]RKW12205.1 MAG: ABC transporter permease [Catonella sp.]AWN19988.1 ABC transporter permease [Streptococcus sobrinus]EMP72801.1 antibiotic transport system permease [Streptococcus sobrinus DSM 20742 = ATCC 33478]OZV24403.1 ABC transporter permease [Streptococcus sobrinus]SQG12695.1 antibiotic transport system permease [Streptococcus sobrinus]
MRILAISKRIIKEMLRDKRTLALMFVAPIIIMWLMNVMFSANTTTDVTIARVDTSGQVVKNLQDTKHVTLKNYTSLKQAKADMKTGQVDAVLTQKGDKELKVRYANTDATKTTMIRQVLKAAIAKDSTSQLADGMKQLTTKLKQIQASLPPQMQTQKPLASQQVSKVSLKESYNYGDKDSNFFNKMIPIMMGFIVFFFVFLISGMALLKERTSGTLDRLLATPVKRSDIVFGYLLAYGLLAVVQTLVIVFATIWLLDIEVVGNVAYVILVNVLMALVALAFGILLSTLAKSEFQMMQFIPLVVIPQFFFSGLIPLDSMASWVRVIGKFLPLPYSGDALTKVMMRGQGLSAVSTDIWVLLFFVMILTVCNIWGMKRYRKV